MELGDDPRVRHDARIGREESGYILPQRHPRRAEPAGKQRGGEIRAAAAQRRHLAFRRRTDEAGDDRDHPPREQREECPLDAPVGPGEVRRRLAERAVGVDEVEGIDILCLRPRGLECGRH